VPLFHWSCTWASGGEDASYVFDQVWQQFAVYRQPGYRYYDDGNAFTPALGVPDHAGAFWPIWEPSRGDTQNLRRILVYERGRCGHYALLLKSLCALHADCAVMVEIRPVSPYGVFHVKYRGAPGLPGHVTPDPGQEFFEDHALCYRTDKRVLYDPSYCVAFVGDQGDPDLALQRYEAACIDDYSLLGFPPRQPGNPPLFGMVLAVEDETYWHWTGNPAGCQLRYGGEE